MSFVFFAHAALLGSSRSSRTDVYVPGTQNLVPCLDKNYWLIPKRRSCSHLERKYSLKGNYVSVEIFA